MSRNSNSGWNSGWNIGWPVSKHLIFSRGFFNIWIYNSRHMRRNKKRRAGLPLLIIREEPYGTKYRGEGLRGKFWIENRARWAKYGTKSHPEKRSQNLGEILYSYRRARQISIGIDWRSQWKFEIWDGRPIKYWMKRGYEFHSIFGFRPSQNHPYSP